MFTSCKSEHEDNIWKTCRFRVKRVKKHLLLSKYESDWIVLVTRNSHTRCRVPKFVLQWNTMRQTHKSTKIISSLKRNVTRVGNRNLLFSVFSFWGITCLDSSWWIGFSYIKMITKNYYYCLILGHHSETCTWYVFFYSWAVILSRRSMEMRSRESRLLRWNLIWATARWKCFPRRP